MMEAAVFVGDSATRIERVPIPSPGPPDVLVRLEGTGVCASNLPAWEGRPWLDYPLAPGAPGHEGWGVVEAVGADVSTVAPGERVALISSHAYAEYDLAPEDAVVALPPALDAMPVPGEPLACAVNVCRRAGIEPGEWVIVLGIGFLGAVVTRLAARAGARVVAVSRRPFARDLARRFGAAVTVAFGDPARTVADIRAATGDGLAPVVIEAIGSQASLDVASRVTRTAGRLVIAGYHQDGPRTVDLQDWNWKGLDVVNAHERAIERYTSGLREAIPLLIDGTIDLGRLLGEPMPLSRLDAAFRLLVDRPDGFVKAAIDLRSRA